jgi:hypothetical protein
MPNTIEAFFVIANGDASAAAFVKEAHETFLQLEMLTKEQVPLLKLDPTNWQRPLSA